MIPTSLHFHKLFELFASVQWCLKKEPEATEVNILILICGFDFPDYVISVFSSGTDDELEKDTFLLSSRYFNFSTFRTEKEDME